MTKSFKFVAINLQITNMWFYNNKRCDLKLSEPESFLYFDKELPTDKSSHFSFALN